MTLRSFAAASAAILLAACGSSSKSSPPPPVGRQISYTGSTAPASLDASTSTTVVVGEAVAVVDELQVVSDPSNALGAAAPQQLPSLQGVLSYLADARHGAQGSSVATGPLYTDGGPCTDGGSGSIALNDADGIPTTTTSGDYFEIAFANCNEGGIIHNGSIRLTFNSSGGDLVMNPATVTTSASFGMTLAYGNYSVQAADGSWAGWNGNMTVALGIDVDAGTMSFGVSGTFLEAARGDETGVKKAFRLAALPASLGGDGKYHQLYTEVFANMGTVGATSVERTMDLDARVCTLKFGGCLNVITNPIFRVHSAYTDPYVGTLRVEDDGGDYVQVAAVNEATGACTVSWDINGSTGTLDTTWNEL